MKFNATDSGARMSQQSLQLEPYDSAIPWPVKDCVRNIYHIATQKLINKSHAQISECRETSSVLLEDGEITNQYTSEGSPFSVAIYPEKRHEMGCRGSTEDILRYESTSVYRWARFIEIPFSLQLQAIHDNFVRSGATSGYWEHWCERLEVLCLENGYTFPGEQS